jgi:hypothetical protein
MSLEKNYYGFYFPYDIEIVRKRIDLILSGVKTLFEGEVPLEINLEDPSFEEVATTWISIAAPKNIMMKYDPMTFSRGGSDKVREAIQVALSS